MSVEPLRGAVASTRSVLVTVGDDQLGLPTPCALWTVADVIDHVVGGHRFFAEAVGGGAGDEAAADVPSGDSATVAELVAAYDEATAATVAAFEGEGAMERLVRLPFGELPGAVFLGIAATDTFTHGWDLARATGQATDLAPELAVELLDRVRPLLGDGLRGAEGEKAFGPRQEAPAGATKADEVAAFMGRRV